MVLTGDVLPIMLPLMFAVLIIGVLTIRDSLAPMQELARRAARISSLGFTSCERL